MYKRILTVQDLSCLGRCSGAVALPVLSAWGHETVLLPTALLSTHTGFRDPYVRHLTDCTRGIAAHWKSQGLRFDGMLTGYPGSEGDVGNVLELLELLDPRGLCVVDPAMADHGRLYGGLDEGYVRAMEVLCARADIILPNVTEAAILAGLPMPERVTREEAEALLRALPNERVILTGAVEEAGRTGVAVKEGNVVTFYYHEQVPGSFSGTGDLYAACFMGGLFREAGLQAAAAFAADFTGSCVRETARDPARAYGVKFEPLLGEIVKKSGEWQ